MSLSLCCDINLCAVEDKQKLVNFFVFEINVISLFSSSRNAQVEVKNKKGNSPLWLAANGGHLPVVEILYNVGADIDSQDNRKVLS